MRIADWKLFVVGFVWVLLGAVVGVAGAADKLQFNRDIRPILSEHCFACHGPDRNARQGNLRLDQRESALAMGESGEPAIVVGALDRSELVRRIDAEEPGEIMPPPKANKPLSSAQRELLKRWVLEGAEYQGHWAFLPPVRHAPPEVNDGGWHRNPIDRFLLARLEREGWDPSPEAPSATLLRRLALDLTGLPPAPADVARFEQALENARANDLAVQNEQPPGTPMPTGAADAVYEQWVDRYLASPHFGERMATDWLDAARYADTNGYQVDRDREMYAWRDWVIAAFNENLPFDQFTIQQLAGDLLPNPTLAQRIATGFHRNHLLNEEGGVIPEEFLAEYCADRVETTAAIWLGQTLMCARCHDHKYDPFTQRDYYGLFAFFHNVNEKGLGNYGANIRRNAPPILKLPAPELESRMAIARQELAQRQQQLAEVEMKLAEGDGAWIEQLRASAPEWRPVSLLSARMADGDLPLDADGAFVRIPPQEPGRHRFVLTGRFPPGSQSAGRLEFRLAKTDAPSTGDASVQFQLGQVSVLIGPLTSESAAGDAAAKGVRTLVDRDAASKIDLQSDRPAAALVELEPSLAPDADRSVRIEVELEFKDKRGAWEVGISAANIPQELLASDRIVSLARQESLDDALRKQLEVFRRGRNPEYRRLTEQVGQLTKSMDEIDLQIPTTLVMEELATPRVTRIMIRGAYDKLGDEVSPATPSALPPLPPDFPRNRLGLARWLVSSENPLTARVTVARFWQALLGVGLVRTVEDFGSQGELPSHPELLDWLATEFVRSGWDVKHTLRLIVTSSAYRQSSGLAPAHVLRDPDNRWLGRGPRFRLQAEFLRDQALAASGLLVETIGGPSVRPYHPPGLYEQVVAGSSADRYVTGQGADLYRRSLYTYWKRSVPNPALLTFDMPFREACALRRPRTNTPLQALNLLNDPTFVEAARCLAERMLAEGGTPDEQLAWGFRRVLVRQPRPEELAILVAAQARATRSFQENPAAAAELIGVGATPVDSKLDPVQVAALMTVASTLLNLDEAVTKE
ncbi:MAG: PSD1 and planctomycete cytochrome C domain-containing protein [Planctomycetales bacterium]